MIDKLNTTSAVSTLNDKSLDAKLTYSIDEKAEEFVAVMFTKFVSAMFEDRETDGIMGGGFGEEIFKGLYSEILAKKLAESGGLADDLKQNIKMALESYETGNKEIQNEISISA